MITERQEKILDFLVAEYIRTSEPVASATLKQKAGLDCCPATVRIDLQELAKMGFVNQPHTSAGKVPTQKAYKYFSKKCQNENQKIFNDFIVRQIDLAHQEMEQEMINMQRTIQALENDNLFDILNALDGWHKQR